MRVKICGITCLEDALLAVEKGAWAIGFNFYPLSPRFVSLETAKDIIQQLPTTSMSGSPVVKVGLFIGYEDEAIIHNMDTLSLDYAQVYHHQPRSLELMQRMILALQIEQEADLLAPEILQSYHAILLDAPRDLDDLYGGMGRKGNWDLAAKLTQDYSIILAGGLTPKNVAEAIGRVNPYAVDVASGVEESAGIKNKEKMGKFLLNCVTA